MPSACNQSTERSAWRCLSARVHFLRVISSRELDDIRFAHRNFRGRVDFTNSEILQIAAPGNISISVQYEGQQNRVAVYLQ
jgi:hypothetical protein